MPHPVRVRVVLYCAFAACVGPGAGHAQEFPARPVRMIVAYAPGGATDIMARLVAKHLTETWGQQVVVDNRPGAGGTVGSDLVAKASPDGHTLLMAASPEIVIAPAVYRKMSYGPERDLAPVTLAGLGPYMLVVHASVPATGVREFIAYAKSRPRQLNMASGGSGTAIHLTGELFKSMAGIDMVHVPYKGSGPAVSDLVGGQVQAMFETIAVAMPHVRSGRLRTLGMATAQRSTAAPDLPTISESGLPGFTGGTWYGLLAPRGTSPALVARIQRDAVRYLSASDTREFLGVRGIDAVGNTPAEFRTFIRDETLKWAKVVRDAGITLDP